MCLFRGPGRADQDVPEMQDGEGSEPSTDSPSSPASYHDSRPDFIFKDFIEGINLLMMSIRGYLQEGDADMKKAYEVLLP